VGGRADEGTHGQKENARTGAQNAKGRLAYTEKEGLKMLGQMDLRGAVILFLILLPAWGLGFFAGLVVMRKNAERVIRWQRKQIAKLQRRAQEAPTPWIG
jgi:hypothetical protein